MDHLVHVEEKEITIAFELGQKCKAMLRIRSLMHTMTVAFKLQTTSPNKFSVRPSNGYIPPLADVTLEILLRPQQELPPTFPFSDEKFVLKTALAPFSNDNAVLPQKVPKEWFSSPTTHVYVDAKLKVVYIGVQLLRECIACEDENAVEQMLTKNNAVSIAADEDGKTALHAAASKGSSKLVNMLLQGGAEIDVTDVDGRTPLWEAISAGHVELVKELLARGARTGVDEPFRDTCTAAIHVAATLVSPQILEMLIAKRADLETKDQKGSTALHYAVEAQRIESLKALLRGGADMNARRVDGRTPLLIAAENGSFEMVQLLLESGANPHIKAENGQATSDTALENGHVVLMDACDAGEDLLRAARRGDTKAVATLLQHGGGKKVWAQDSAGWTALHVAAFKGHMRIVRRLLLTEGGAKALQEQDAEGHTPLHCAAEGGSKEVVELLLAMGADPLAASSRGATPPELASALGFTAIARLIQQQACHHAVIYPSHGRLKNDAFEERIGLPQQEPAQPSPNPSPSRKRSATPTPRGHEEALTASCIRFSTPKRLPQREQQLRQKPCPTPSSSLFLKPDKVCEYTMSDSLTVKKSLSPSQSQASCLSDRPKSSVSKLMMFHDSEKASEIAAHSKQPPVPQGGALEPPATALRPMKNSNLEEEPARASQLHHETSARQIAEHRKGINASSKLLQKSLPQSVIKAPIEVVQSKLLPLCWIGLA